MSVKNYFSEMPKYARICRIIPENVSKRQWCGLLINAGIFQSFVPKTSLHQHIVRRICIASTYCGFVIGSFVNLSLVSLRLIYPSNSQL